MIPAFDAAPMPAGLCAARGLRTAGLCLVALLAACAGPRPDPGCAGCPDMVALPSGRFLMGTPESDDESWSAAREGPQHEVRIARPFAIGRHEVTRAEFARFAAEAGEPGGGCLEWSGTAWVGDPARDWRRPGFPQTDRDPVVCVSWNDAQAYARWLSARTGRRYRLPSEAEWEYAARAGTVTRRHWGDDANQGCPYANFSDRTLWEALRVQPAAACADGFVHTAPVGSLAPNAWGLHDMLGNAWEWTADCWREGYAGAPADGSARDATPCPIRVNRGAGWNSNPRNLRVSNRGNYTAASRYNIVGFRLARDVDRAGRGPRQD